MPRGLFIKTAEFVNRIFSSLTQISLVLLLLFCGCNSHKDAGSGCVACHGDKGKMTSLGYPQFYVTAEMAKKESKHPNAGCQDCHLGNGQESDPKKAHEGLLKPLFIGESGNVLLRSEAAPGPLLHEGSDRISRLLPFNSEVRNILWHDRNPETLDFDPEITQKTCGRADCHPKELKQFRATIMGANFRQRTMKTWLKPYGPHNCGPSFADLPPQIPLKEASFDYKNTEEIRRNLNTGFSAEQAVAKQKFCNVCHAGCLDCHYSPDRESGTHSFIKKPDSETCSGNGRGMSTCHPGAMSSRRGEAYIGGDYSVPAGMAPDIHYKNNIHCIDCHRTGGKGMGDIQRKADCLSCHAGIEKAHKDGPHRNLDCAACHINELRGYQATVWGPGRVAGKQNPFKKYSLYYGVQKPPVIIKDQKGIWMPVKIWPHSAGNIKNDVRPSERVMFRWPDGETRDAYYTAGTFDGLPGSNKHLLWLELQQAAHSYGKSRTCESCHNSESQLAVSVWEFEDNQGAEPFKGTYKIVAGKNGLRIDGIRNTTPIKLLKGARLEDFASWVYLGDKWKAPGDFSIKADKEKYRRLQKAFRDVETELTALDVLSRDFDKTQMLAYKDFKGAALHNPEGGSRMADRFRNR